VIAAFIEAYITPRIAEYFLSRVKGYIDLSWNICRRWNKGVIIGMAVIVSTLLP